MSARRIKASKPGENAFLRALWAGEEASPLGRLLDMHLLDIKDGEVTFEAFPTSSHYNPGKVVHGGYAAALVDSAMGCVVQSKLGPDVKFGTIELKVNYVRPITTETGRVTCTAKLIHFGRRLSTTEARVTDAAGKLYAHGSGTFMVFES